MAWIEQFSVTGLAGRPETIERKLNRHVNVFWGLNGAGKTTLLKILHAAMNNDASGLEELPFDEAVVVFRVGREEGRVVRRFSKAQEQEEPDDDSGEMFMSAEVSVDSPWEIETDQPTDWETSWDTADFSARVVQGKFSHSYLPITRVTDSRRRGAPSYDFAGVTGRYSTDDIFVEQVRDRWRDYAIKSTSRIRDIQQQGLATVLAILFGGFRGPQASLSKGGDVEPEEAYSLVQSFLREQNLPLVMPKGAFVEKFHESPTHRQVVSEIQEVRRETDEVLSPQREFQRIIDSMYAGNKHLVLSSPRAPRTAGSPPIGIRVQDKSIPLKSLSSGEKQLLQILLETLGASGETVMIDEPELSLHVVWQRELVDSMQRVNEDCQLLLATHSPEIMAEVPDDCVFEL
jgi:predicted ATPase